MRQAQCQSSLSGAIIDRRKRRNTAAERAARMLTDQQRQEQLEEEERVKRQKTSLDDEMATPTKSLSQQRLLEKLRAARANATPTQSPGTRRATVAATPEEYAEWRAHALEFMRNKKEKERKTRSVNSRDVHLETLKAVADSK
ncbi:unnamed protein product [Phytophthora lilii]|uniref:Unnamed protein product n=1 Tax=Phytophthora lilii TaxID=2077276 RepID=A0A9W6TIF0_9STRA|nr:unnamed protein product [Phytophthora lilii]